ncbi:hypothetical protein AKJ09_02659 [Labilithrix luteola]|uniref:Transmembrane protein n=1 Tax=Labilithrix luteola TaxID=1391654 RepID=A0A0K1PR28_9BACT|nr:hypothetical protein [Labilithrix luteola]AKU95995.1 hypothetical protein AKJ09_02659 [Labilithrix luteola]
MYREAPDLEVRVKELEQTLAEMKVETRAMEREVWAARRTLKLRKVIAASALGGLVSVGGSMLGAAAAIVLANPWLILWGNLIGFGVGFVFGVFTAEGADDDDFPKAPPPRLYF